ncbi:UNVERIFIED_CONTAM: hypothetical protein RMT77_007843 [Armadillidium vulgare]
MIKICYSLRHKRIIIFELIFMSSFISLLMIIKTSDVNNLDQLRFNILEETLEEEEFEFEDKIRLQPECENHFEIKTLEYRTEKYDDVTIKRHPNLPEFLTYSNNISSSIPDIPSIRWTGTVFQESWKDSPKFLLYSAHFDTRFNSSLFIHILAFYDGEENTYGSNFQNYFCQIWFNVKDNPVAVHVYDSIRISSQPYRESRLNPYVLSCKVPLSENFANEFPIAVSLVSHQCQIPRSVLKISASPVKKMINPLSKNLTVGICGKALFYYNDDFSTRLIEWVEIMKVLGVSKIFLYEIKCHKNVKKVLDFYEKEGIVKVITFHYPPPVVEEGTFIRLWSKIKKKEFWSLQNMYLNDCLLRNKDDFDFLGVFDSDEIPIMKKHRSLPDLLMFLRSESNEPESYFLKWKTFFEDLESQTPPHLKDIDRSYIFNHNIRTKLNSTETKIYETNGKTFYNTNQVSWISPHMNLVLESESNLAPKVKPKTLERDVAYMAHFSDHQCTPEEYCIEDNMEEETALLHIREKVVEKMNKLFDVLKI